MPRIFRYASFLLTILLAAGFFAAIPVSACAAAQLREHRMHRQGDPGATIDYMEFLTSTCDRYNVPVRLMKAIIEKESRYHIWAINIQGKGYFLRSKEEAVKLIYDNLGKSFDVGIMQINVQWLRKFGIKPEDALEPIVNILLGVWIMNENLIAYGPTWKAVAAYHTPPSKNPERAAAYAKSIWEIYKKLEAAAK